MFKNADRIPMSPATAHPDTTRSDVVRPWGLRRMAPYKSTSVVGFVATRIDPATQMGAAADGELIDAKHKQSNTGTEKRTSTSRDAKNAEQDTDHAQDSDQD